MYGLSGLLAQGLEALRDVLEERVHPLPVLVRDVVEQLLGVLPHELCMLADGDLLALLDECFARVRVHVLLDMVLLAQPPLGLLEVVSHAAQILSACTATTTYEAMAQGVHFSLQSRWSHKLPLVRARFAFNAGLFAHRPVQWSGSCWSTGACVTVQWPTTARGNVFSAAQTSRPCRRPRFPTGEKSTCRRILVYGYRDDSLCWPYPVSGYPTTARHGRWRNAQRTAVPVAASRQGDSRMPNLKRQYYLERV